MVSRRSLVLLLGVEIEVCYQMLMACSMSECGFEEFSLAIFQCIKKSPHHIKVNPLGEAQSHWIKNNKCNVTV
jgi:hypothetical protein